MSMARLSGERIIKNGVGSAPTPFRFVISWLNTPRLAAMQFIC